MTREWPSPVLRRLAVWTLAAALLAGAALATERVVHETVLRPSYGSDGLLVLLAIGSDIGPPHRPGNPLAGRADGIHLIVVDVDARAATIVDFPRDSIVGGQKVNAHLALGGPERLEAQLEAYTGLAIDYWVLTTFRGLENIVDGMDGVEVVIEQRLRDRFSGSDFHPGPQQLRGWQALAFTRDRKSAIGGDFGRTRHQGQLLRFAHAQIVSQQADLPTLTALVALFARNTVSNIPPQELVPLALLATEIDPANVAQVPLQGSAGVGSGGASIVRLAPGDTFDRLLEGVVGP